MTTPALLKGSDSDLLVVSVKLTGTATLTQAPGRLLRGGDLFVTDLWRPFEFVDQGGANAAFYVCLDRLGLSRDYAARAGEALHLSPMASQLQRHFQILLQGRRRDLAEPRRLHDRTGDHRPGARGPRIRHR